MIYLRCLILLEMGQTAIRTILGHLHSRIIKMVFTARCYASAVLAMALCPSVRLSVCLSVCLSVRPTQVGVLLKRLNVGSHKQHHTIAQGL